MAVTQCHSVWSDGSIGGLLAGATVTYMLTVIMGSFLMHASILNPVKL
jgi:hypothetical protein